MDGGGWLPSSSTARAAARPMTGEGGDLIFGAKKFEQLRAGDGVEGFEGRQLAASSTWPRRLRPRRTARPSTSRSTSRAPEYQVLDNDQPSRRQAGCRRQPQVGVALRHDPRRSAEFQNPFGEWNTGQDHGLQRHGRTRPERTRTSWSTTCGLPSGPSYAGEQQVQHREVRLWRSSC